MQTKKLKIAIFTNNYLPNPYGVSTSVDGFRKALIAQGHRVYIFAPHWKGEQNEDEENIFRYPSINLPTKVSFSLVIPYSSKIDKIIDELEIDIIHSQHPYLLGPIAQKWALKKNIPLVFTWHSLYDKYAHYTPFVPDAISAGWAMKNAIGFAEDCNQIITPTQSIKNLILKQNLNHQNISVVPSGVDGNLFAEPDGQKIRQKLNIQDDQIVLVSISRLTEEKNVIFLAKVVSEILIREKNAVFIFGGEGDLKEEIQEIFNQFGVADRVFMPGKLERTEVKDYFEAGDIFVYASTSETQGTIVTESMYLGKSCVAVDSTGVSDVVINNKTGILVKENIAEFKSAVFDLIKNKDKRLTMGLAAKKEALENYTIEACSKKLLKVYRKTIEKFSAKNN
jgi:glycosyltransferase involved in cell wall biosynthesis